MDNKNHIDYADELDILVRHDRRAGFLNGEFGDFIGKGIQLFSFGGGILRTILYNILTDFHAKNGYYVIETPIIASTRLYKVSGHLSYYKQNMYIFNIEDEEYAIKPMNCPHHILLFINLIEKNRKIKLPFRTFELGRVHRYEVSGSLYGLLRVRGFTQDDSHIFITMDKLESEIEKLIFEMKEIYEKLFNIKFEGESLTIKLSIHDKNKMNEYSGSLEDWENSVGVMRRVLEKVGKKFGFSISIDIGEAAFYGPKYDFKIKIGEKEWQLGTIQLDFNLPRNFRLRDLTKEYFGIEDIFIIHRAYLGSIERFIGSYLEVFNGRLPFVLNPIQLAIIKVNTRDEYIDSKINEKAQELYLKLKNEDIRAVVIESSKTELSNVVRILESKYKPSIIVYIGEKEINKGYSIRYYNLEARKVETINGDENKLFELIEELERKVFDLNKKKYRLFEDFNFLFE